MNEITREELWQRIESGDEFVLVDALAPMSFAHSHLPGAINLPPEWVDERGPRRIPDLDTEVVQEREELGIERRFLRDLRHQVSL